MRDLSKSLSAFKKTEACSAISAALIHESKSEVESAMEQLEIAITACNANAGLSSEIKMILAQSCLNNGMEESAEAVMLDIMSNAPNDATVARAVAVLERAGRTDLSETLVQESKQQIADLIASCEKKVQQGDFHGAVDFMARAAQRMPENPEVIVNTALTILKCIENTGWDDGLGAQVHAHVETARRLDPTSANLDDLSTLYRSMLKKYSIPLDRMNAKFRPR